MFTHTTEIARSPEDVLAYLDQLDRHGEWQTDIKRVIDVTPGPVGVGTRATEYRKMPIGTAKVTYEIAEYESLIDLARELRENKIVKLLGQTLKEEQATLKKMEQFEKKIKPEQMGGEVEEEEGTRSRRSRRAA